MSYLLCIQITYINIYLLCYSSRKNLAHSSVEVDVLLVGLGSYFLDTPEKRYVAPKRSIKINNRLYYRAYIAYIVYHAEDYTFFRTLYNIIVVDMVVGLKNTNSRLIKKLYFNSYCRCCYTTGQ